VYINVLYGHRVVCVCNERGTFKGLKNKQKKKDVNSVDEEGRDVQEERHSPLSFSPICLNKWRCVCVCVCVLDGNAVPWECFFGGGGATIFTFF